jgi:hypothetical protein
LRNRMLLLYGMALFLLGTIVSAQSNRQIDALLAQKTATIEQAAYLILAAGGRIDETASDADAYAYLVAHRWIERGRKASDAVRLDELCLITMKSLDIKGGIMYMIFPTKRYAFREMTYQNAVNASGGAFRTLSGDEVIRILRNGLSLKEGGK